MPSNETRKKKNKKLEEKGYLRDKGGNLHQPGTPGFAAALSYQQSCLRQQNLPSPVTYPVNPATLQSYQQPVDSFGNFSTQGLGLTSAFGYPQYPPIQNFQQPAAHPGNLGLASTGPHALSGVQQQYVPGIQQLPPSGHYQPAYGGHYQAAHYQPAYGGHHQPAYGGHQQPPVTAHYQPPVTDHQPLTANPQESAATPSALSVPTKALPSLSISHQQSGIAAHPEPEISILTGNPQESNARLGLSSVPRKPSPSLSLSHQQTIINVDPEPEIRTHRQPSNRNHQEPATWFGPPSIPKKPSPPLSPSHQPSIFEAHAEPEIRTHYQPLTDNPQESATLFCSPSMPKEPSPSLSPSHQPTIVEAHDERGIRTHPQHLTNNTQRSAAFYGLPHPLTIREALVEISGNARQSSSHDSSSPITSSEQSRKRKLSDIEDAIDTDTNLQTTRLRSTIQTGSKTWYSKMAVEILNREGADTISTRDPKWVSIQREYFPDRSAYAIAKKYSTMNPTAYR